MKYYGVSTPREDIFFSPDLSGRVLNEFVINIPLITRFCKEKKVSLARVDTANEEGYEELLCVFNDTLGGYTIKGIRESLK